MKLKYILLILLIFFTTILISGCLSEKQSEINSNIIIDEAPINESITEVIEFIPEEILYPIPTYTPILKEYNTVKRSRMMISIDSSSYITPNNEWVKYYASQMYIDNDYSYPRLRYKSDDNIVEFNYLKSNIQFGVKDYWINPDYYLTHEFKGKCADFSNAVTSMMLSGEMSIKDNDIFIKQIIPAKVVIVVDDTLTRGDAHVVYYKDNATFIGEISLEDGGIFFRPSFGEYEIYNRNPIFEYTDKYFKQVGNFDNGEYVKMT